LVYKSFVLLYSFVYLFSTELSKFRIRVGYFLVDCSGVLSGAKCGLRGSSSSQSGENVLKWHLGPVSVPNRHPSL
jgi:hypothetical protein